MNIVITIGLDAMPRGRTIGPLATLALALSLASCASSAGPPPGSISVVASTSVYGGIVEQLAGRLAGGKVQITSIISDPSADPHSYEANTRTQLALSRADLIIENGGGYDDFVDTMRNSAGTHATVLNAVDISGTRATSGGQLNEHVWYDLPTAEKVAARIAGFLIAHDRADAGLLRANEQRFIAGLHALESREAAIRRADSGAGVAITEPVPLYLLSACGLVDRTPVQFRKAVEDETDVAPRVLQQTLALFSAHQVRLLAYNEQTTGPQTQEVLSAAKANHVPAVAVTETLPGGKTYLSWMAGNLQAVAAALNQLTN
jgi:zinc/manganese transport system substrate-binding protein